MDFDEQVKRFADATRSILELAEAMEPEPDADGVRSEAEFYISLAAAAKQAIRESGKSREQVIDGINRRWGRVGPGSATDTGEDSKRPISVHMFNNYLSKPAESRLPTWLVVAICEETGTTVTIGAMAAKIDATVISASERHELMLGKLEQHIKGMHAFKRQLQKGRGSRCGVRRITGGISDDV